MNKPGHMGENLTSSSCEERELYHKENKADVPVLKHNGKRKWGKMDLS